MKKRILALLILCFIIFSFITPIYMKCKENNNTNIIRQQSELINLTPNTEISDCVNNVKYITKTEFFKYGWTTSNLNIRKEPNLNSEILYVLEFNTCIQYLKINDKWLQVKYRGLSGYVSSDYISDKECLYTEYYITNNIGFKSYMAYETIKDRKSDQYILQSQYAYTGKYGIRQVNKRYCAAIGTAFNAGTGTYFDLVLENGTIIPCIVGDIKSDTDTEDNNIATKYNGCICEFIVDTSALDSDIKILGDISECNKEWNSKSVIIKIYNKNIFD